MYPCVCNHIDSLVHDCSNSIADALELLQSCTKPSIKCWDLRVGWHCSHIRMSHPARITKPISYLRVTCGHYSNSVARRPSRQPPLNRRVGHLPVGQDPAVIYGPSRYVIRDKNLQVNFFFLLSKNIEILSAPLIFTVFFISVLFLNGEIW